MNKKMLLRKIALWTPVLAVVLGYSIGQLYEANLEFGEWFCFTLFVGWPIACISGVTYYLFNRKVTQKEDTYV